MPLEKLVIASNNPGKLAEFEQLLKPLKFDIRPQSDFGVAAPEETGLTFVENALIKARAAARATGLPSLGDDSGLVVDALNGAPGIRSSRFAGDDAGDEGNNRLLLERLEGVPDDRRGAAFFCCLVLLRHAVDAAPYICTGTWHGRILDSPRGTGGFGYDPVFLDTRLGVSAAELSPAEKNRISHRGQAMQKLLEKLKAR